MSPRGGAETVTDFIQNCIDGVMIGSGYALLAIGFTITFGVCLANSYHVYKSPLFHRLVNPGGNGTIWVHA